MTESATGAKILSYSVPKHTKSHKNRQISIGFFEKSNKNQNSTCEDSCEKSQLSPKSMDFETSTVITRACEVVETSKFDTHGFNIIRKHS